MILYCLCLSKVTKHCVLVSWFFYINKTTHIQYFLKVQLHYVNPLHWDHLKIRLLNATWSSEICFLQTWSNAFSALIFWLLFVDKHSWESMCTIKILTEGISYRWFWRFCKWKMYQLSLKNDLKAMFHAEWEYFH